MNQESRRKPPREGLTVREARPTDLNSLVELWTEFVSFHERVGRQRLAPQGAEMRVREEMRSDLTDRAACLLVAEKGGELQGYVLGRLHPVPPMYEGHRLGVVQELAVTEAARGRGVGRRLATRLLDWFRDRRVDRVELTVLEENEEARAFWERSGFRLSGFRLERRL